MQTIQVVLEFGWWVIGLVGGGGLVLVAACGFVSKFIADRTIESHRASLNTELERLKNDLSKDMENYKLKIRRAELLFEQEMSAASSFSKLYRSISPSYDAPDKGWYDVCIEVAGKFSNIERDIDQYLIQYESILPTDLRKKLRACVTLAAQNKFARQEWPEAQAEETERAAAESLLSQLDYVENGIFSLVKNESRV